MSAPEKREFFPVRVVPNLHPELDPQRITRDEAAIVEASDTVAVFSIADSA